MKINDIKVELGNVESRVKSMRNVADSISRHCSNLQQQGTGFSDTMCVKKRDIELISRMAKDLKDLADIMLPTPEQWGNKWYDGPPKGWRVATYADLANLEFAGTHQVLLQKCAEMDERPLYDEAICIVTWKDGNPRCLSEHIWNITLSTTTDSFNVNISDGCGDFEAKMDTDVAPIQDIDISQFRQTVYILESALVDRIP